MNTNSKRLGIYLTIMLILTAIATTLRTVASIIHLDYSSGFYTKSTLITVANVIVVLTALGMLSYVFAATRIKLRASFSTSATYVPTGILGVATAFLSVRIFSHVLNTGDYRIFRFNPSGVNNAKELFVRLLSQENILSLIGLLAGILALLSIAHHFLNAYTSESQSVARGYFALTGILFLALYSILIYLDGTLAINEASKILRQTAFIMSAIFLLFEARISLGREMWRIYTAFGLSAAVLTAYTSIPAIITYYVNGVTLSSFESKSLASLEEYLFLFALFIFTVSRLLLTVLLKEEKENELIKALGEYANDREEKVNESYARFQEMFAAKQLSIFELYGMEEAIAEEPKLAEITEEAEPEEEKKELIISDDAIYESIFGRMPERPEPEAAEAEDEPVIEDERAPEEIAEDILNAVDKVLSESAKDNEKETEK